MKRWSKCWRRVVNRLLSKLLVNTTWHAHVEDKEASGFHRTLKFGPDCRTEARRVLGGRFEWLFAHRWNNTFTFMWSLSDDVEESFTFGIAVPWLFSLYLELDILRQPWIRKLVGNGGLAYYGIEADPKSISFQWHGSKNPADTRFAKTFYWQDIHGKPETNTYLGERFDLVYHQPSNANFPNTAHDIRLVQRTTVTKWPRFWKPDEVVAGFEVAVDEPPMIPAVGLPAVLGRKWDGIYGVFLRDALTPNDAIHRYRTMVTAARNTMVA